MFLKIKNLNASIDSTKILNDFSLNVEEGEIHAIMGPNGSGKSTLANVIAGNEDYTIDSGEIIFKDKNIFDFNIEERSHLGLFLAFQYPIEIPGVNITPFLRAALNSKLKNNNEKEIDNLNFSKLLREKASLLGIDIEMLKRPLNVGFSGGEKKRYEILQMSILNPALSIFDETDSGLDIDALKIVTDGISNLKNKNNSFIIITHYRKLLDYINPDYVHVMKEGKIIKSGDKSLAEKIESEGYKNFWYYESWRNLF